jgi:peroxiredoxin
MRLHVGDVAPNVLLVNMDDAPVHLADMWQSHVVIVSFLRHFG